MKEKKRPLAVFDIDGTVFRSSLVVEVLWECIREGMLPRNAQKYWEAKQEAWRNREGSYEEYIDTLVEAFWKDIKGVPEQDFLKVAHRVLERQQRRVYRFTRDLIVLLKKKDYFLVAISHSPKYIVDIFAKYWGFDKSYGMLLELDEQHRFTGRALHRDLIMDKSNILDRVLEKEAVTLVRSVGVGDTSSDISFLKRVERPICFNPNSKLYAAAKKRKWEVVVERKDVIYKGM